MNGVRRTSSPYGYIPCRLRNRSKNYGQSFLDKMRSATTPLKVRLLLKHAPRGASSGTQRKWERAAAARLKVLEAAA